MKLCVVVFYMLVLGAFVLCGDPEEIVIEEEAEVQPKKNPTETDEIVIDEVVDDHIKQHLLFDRNYNSSFTISVPILTVVVPGTSSANGIVKFSVSHLTMLSLVSISFVGLVYPIFLGPKGKLHRSYESDSYLDRIENFVLDNIF